jgi:hypothetical protein
LDADWLKKPTVQYNHMRNKRFFENLPKISTYLVFLT